MKYTGLKANAYLRSSVVLAIDTIVSLLASTCVLLFYILASKSGHVSQNFLFSWLGGALFASVASFYLIKSYRAVIRYYTLKEAGQLCLAALAKDLIFGLVLAISLDKISSAGLIFALLGIDFLITFSALMLVRVLMLATYKILMTKHDAAMAQKRVLVYGSGDKAAAMVTRMEKSPHYKVVGFIQEGDKVKGQLLKGLPVYYFRTKEDVEEIIGKEKSSVLFAYHDDARRQRDKLIDYCVGIGAKVYISPSVDEVTDGKLVNEGVRKIRIDDLLGRNEIKISMDEIRKEVEGKCILVTGAAGSIGSELCRQLAVLGVGKLIMLDNAETPLHNVRLEFEEKWPDLDFVPVIGDVRLPERLDFVFKKYSPQMVFHAAAYKHVPLMEENPCEAVMANVYGSRNVADKCLEHGVEKMVMISTDKAVNPTNIMGCTKRLAEIYVQSLGLAVEEGTIKGKTTFVTTRFGNVLGSSGSVIPRFKEQIEKGGPVTVTHPEIRRYFMTIPEACRLVMEAMVMSTDTKIFVFDMGDPVKIADLAAKMIELSGYEVDKDIQIEYTGLRPGEKLYEEVLASKENTAPTAHERIFKAKVREYPYSIASNVMSELTMLAREVDIPTMVIKMKAIVPEFKSKHSEFEKYDN